MTLPAPKLDDRHFQDLVDEAKKRIPHFCEEWTDHNVSDPGVTLIELFAWMTDILLYRVNQVPDLHYIKMMEMLGIKLKEPQPAKVPVTFWLSAPQPLPVLIPAGTEVASTQTENEPAIVFTADKSFSVFPPQLKAVISRISTRQADSKQYVEHNMRRLEAGFDGDEVFSAVPQIDDALYFGFANDLSHHILGFDMDCDPAGGAGIDPTLPPYVWEVASPKKGIRWEPCEVEEDTTKGMNGTGRMTIHVPAMNKYTINNKSFYWLRLRIKEITPAEERDGMSPYQISPRLRQLNIDSWGGTVPTTHTQQVRNEFLGRSDGSAGQRFQLQRTPILVRQPGEHVVVQVEGEPPQVWHEVPDFADSRATDRHFLLDGITGEVRFGPAIREQDGTVKLYGDIPPRNANIIFERYRIGGGQVGNVQRGVINTLKTGIPFISRVENREDAWGGLDAESLDSAMSRAPKLLRSRDRAVTEADFEFLAREALPAGISRVKCLQPRPSDAGRVAPGQIYVLVVPHVLNPPGYLDPVELELKEGDVQILSNYLDDRRLLTTRLDIRAPAYRWVSVKAMLRAAPGVPQSDVETAVLERLYRFLNPLTGGPDGKGWPFGRDLYISDVYQCLQGMPDVLFIRGVEMYAAEPGGQRQGRATELMEIVAHGVVASGLHEVEFI